MDDDELTAIAGRFRLLAEVDFGDASPLYARLSRQAATDRDVLSMLGPAAPHDRLPHLLFAAVQDILLDEGAGPLEVFDPHPYAAFGAWCREHRGEIEALVATRVTQTNEVGRCAPLLACLAAVAEDSGRPLAVLEVGTSAGLNLLLDRYRYRFGEGDEVGPETSGVVLRPRIEGGGRPPPAVPEIVWRLGLDRSPVDVADDRAVRWLRACIWPEQRWRIELLERAVAMARRDPPTLRAGDAVGDLARVLEDAPEGAALCVVHTAVLSYLPDRPRFVDLLRTYARDRPLWWVSGEPVGLVPELVTPDPPRAGIEFRYGYVALGQGAAAPCPVAAAGSHGAWMEWLPR